MLSGATGTEEEKQLTLIKESERGDMALSRRWDGIGDLKGKTEKGHCRPGNAANRNAVNVQEKVPRTEAYGTSGVPAGEERVRTGSWDRVLG